MANGIPCGECGGEPVVQLERAGRPATGAHTVCSDCKGAGVAYCWWKLSCRGLPATQLVEGHPACDGCAAELVRELDAERCFYCRDGKPVATVRGFKACDRCLDAMNEIAQADTLPPPAPEDDRAEAALVELCTAVLA